MTRETKGADAMARRWVDDLLKGLACGPATRDVLLTNAKAAFRLYGWAWAGTFNGRGWTWPWRLLSGEDSPAHDDPWCVLFRFCLSLAAQSCGWQAACPNPNQRRTP